VSLHDDLVAGGQGREPEEISDSMVLTCFCACAALVVVVLSVMVF